MKKCAAILFLVLAASASFAQEPTASPRPPGEIILERMKSAKEALAKDEKDFYSQPPYVRVSFFINDEEVPLTNDFSFKFFVNSKEIQPTAIDGSGFLFPPISEPGSVVFKKGDYELRCDVPAGWLKHGAELVFGVVSKLDLLKTEAPFYRIADSEYPKRSAYYEGRSHVSEERFTKTLDRTNTKNVAFSVLAPRVYGDGAVQITAQVNLKNPPR